MIRRITIDIMIVQHCLSRDSVRDAIVVIDTQGYPEPLKQAKTIWKL